MQEVHRDGVNIEWGWSPPVDKISLVDRHVGWDGVDLRGMYPSLTFTFRLCDCKSIVQSTRLQ